MMETMRRSTCNSASITATVFSLSFSTHLLRAAISSLSLLQHGRE
ncbi:hypothetical protein ACP70R_006457 [Stipagrostis hirtigluma subsp. patula]